MSLVVEERMRSKELIEERELGEEHSNWKEPYTLDTFVESDQEEEGNKWASIDMDSKEVLVHTHEEVLEVLILLKE